MSDEIITEVRAIKDAISAKFNYDLRALFVEIKRGEAELQAKGVHLVPPPANPANLPYSALQRGKGRGKSKVSETGAIKSDAGVQGLTCEGI